MKMKILFYKGSNRYYGVSDYYLKTLGAWEETNPFYEIDYSKNEVRMYSYSS